MSILPRSHQTSRQNESFYPTVLACDDVARKLRLLNKPPIICSKNVQPGRLYYSVKSKNIEFLLELEPNDKFLAPVFQIEQRFGELYQESIVDDDLWKCFYRGTVVNEKNSQVILNVCGGLVSRLISTKKKPSVIRSLHIYKGRFTLLYIYM